MGKLHHSWRLWAALCLCALGWMVSTPLHAEKRLGVNTVYCQLPRLYRWEQLIGQGAGYIADTLPWDSWAHISGARADMFFRKYAPFPHKECLEIGLPLFPAWDDQGKPYREIPARWQQAARGDFDSHFVLLAKELVARGYGACHLRPAWEFNGNWFPWGIDQGPAEERGQRAEAFAVYWRRVHEAMMKVPGAEFKWLWNVSVGYEPDGFDFTRAWPGDAYVDFVSVDLYDAQGEYYWTLWKDKETRWTAEQLRDWAWKAQVEGVHTSLSTGLPDEKPMRGMNFYRDFARQKGKGFIISEWGLWDFKVVKSLDPLEHVESQVFGGGDNPAFIQRMYDWIQANDVYAASYFNVRLLSEPIDHALTDEGLGRTSHPLSQQKFLETFVARGFTSGEKLPPTLLFADDFEDGPKPRWHIEPGGWETVAHEDGKALRVAGAGKPKAVQTAALRQGDYRVSFLLKLESPWHGVSVVLLRGPKHEYRVTLRTGADDRLHDVTLLAGTRELTRQQVKRPDAPALNKGMIPVQVRVTPEGAGLRFVAVVDEVEVLNFLDEKPISKSGGCGLLSAEWTQAWVDDFLVITN